MKLATCLLLFVTVSLTPAVACSCNTPPPIENALTEADAVFVGRVVEMAIQRHDGGLEKNACRFEIIEIFKGIEARKKTVLVLTAMDSGSCGYPFELGDKYLVYAYNHKEDIATNMCQRTKPLVRDYYASGKPGPDESGRIEVEQLRALLRKE